MPVLASGLLCSFGNILCCAHLHSVEVVGEVKSKHIKLEQVQPKMQINLFFLFLVKMEWKNPACIMLKYCTGSGLMNISNANLNPQNVQGSRAKL